MPDLGVLDSDNISVTSSSAPLGKKPSKPEPDKPTETAAEAAAKTRSIVEAKFPGGGAGGGGPAGGEHWSSMQPPPFQPLAPMPEPTRTSPQEAWGSMAMVAAAVGGLLTRTHATTALNAAAAVMNGFHDRDLEKTQQSLDRWKAANQNTIASMNYQMDIYKAILGNQYKNFMMDMSITREKRMQAAADLHAASISLHDSVLRQKLEAGDFAGATKHLQDQEKVAEQYMIKSGDAEKAGEFSVALLDLRKSPEYLSAAPMEKYGMELDVLKKYLPESDTRGDGSSKDIKDARSVYSAEFGTGPMQKPDAPTFDAWYKDTWPEWGGGHISARKREALKKTPDYFQLPDGKWLHYKGSGDKADQKNWEPAEAPKPDEPPMDTSAFPPGVVGD